MIFRNTAIPRPARLVIQGVTLAGLVAATVAFASLDKSVDLVVDGNVRSVHAMGTTVDDVLASQGLKVGEHDIVSPAPGTKIADGSRVVVRYGRQLTVMVDGRERQYWTTALTVDEALQQLGLRADSARLSVSRSQPLGRRGLAMDLDTRKDVLLVVGGQSAKRTTYASTVAEVLDEAQVAVGPLDRLYSTPTSPVGHGDTVRVDRVLQKRSAVTRTLAFPIRSTSTASLDKGTTKVTTRGRPGTSRTTYLDTYVNGRLTIRRAVSTIVVQQAVAQVQRVGTRKPSTALPSGSGDGLNWAALAQCESGGNPRAVNPAGYYGLYQFSLSTWRSVGGSGNPVDASPAEQLKRAKILFAKAGAGQWGCGARLYS